LHLFILLESRDRAFVANWAGFARVGSERKVRRGWELSSLVQTSIALGTRRLISFYTIPATFPCSILSSLWNTQYPGPIPLALQLW